MENLNLLITLFTLILFYVTISWPIYIISKKTNIPAAYASWIPTINVFNLAKAGGLSYLYASFLLLFSIAWIIWTYGSFLFIFIHPITWLIISYILYILAYAFLIYILIKVSQVMKRHWTWIFLIIIPLIVKISTDFITSEQAYQIAIIAEVIGSILFIIYLWILATGKN